MTIIDDETGVRLATGSGDEYVKVCLLILTANMPVLKKARSASSGIAPT